ncbi:GNAT family N-acetyltransferase [Globicatella sanguinis]
MLGLAVLPTYQGRGIGRKLMAAVESFAKNNQLSFIRLNSADYRHEAHAFYEAIGYRSNKQQKRFIKNLQ